MQTCGCLEMMNTKNILCYVNTQYPMLIIEKLKVNKIYMCISKNTLYKYFHQCKISQIMLFCAANIVDCFPTLIKF